MLRTLLKLLLGMLFRVSVTGHGSQLTRGRPLVLANCDSLLDPLLAALFLPGNPLIVLPQTLAKHWIGALVRRVADCAEPAVGGDAIKRLVREVRAGRPVVMFPQERATTTGSTMKVYGAAGVIALRAEADVIPLRIQGTLHTRWAVTSARWPHRWLQRVTLVIQPSAQFSRPAVSTSSAVAGGVAGTRRRRMNDELQALMQRAMADAEPRRALFCALLGAVALHGRRNRIIEDVRGQVRTYADLLKGSLALGRLTAKFTEPGERVGVLLPNLGATVCLVFGLVSRGRVAAMLNYSSGIESLRGACVAATIRTVITSRSFIAAAKLEPLLAGVAACRIVYLEDLRETLTLSDKLWILYAMLRPLQALPVQDPAQSGLGDARGPAAR